MDSVNALKQYGILVLIAVSKDFKFIYTVILTLMAFIADFVMEIIFALEIGGFESIRENSCNANI